jgi:drug/metabolite transporter (DMT)-like permease
MKMKVVACLAFLLNTALFATSYSVSREALGRIEPIVFTFFVMMALVPIALCLIMISWHEITREVVKSGVLLGSCQCLGLFTIYIALKYNSATSTAFFPALNGFLAAVCAWIFLRRPIAGATWLAGVVSAIGAILLITNSPIGGVRGALIAFLGGLFCTFYVFLADYEQRGKSAYRPLLGIQLLTMALWANLVVLLFGDWQAVHPALPKDLWVILYMAGGTICLPTLITVLLQRYISPITVAFIYILEPVLGAIFANLYLHELLPLNGYLGGGLIVAGALIHTWGMAGRPARVASRSNENTLVRGRITDPLVSQRARLRSTAFYPLLCCAVGSFILYKVGGFPPLAWDELYRVSGQIPLIVQRGAGPALALLAAQALSWLVAWGVVLFAGCLALYRIARGVQRLLTPAPEPVAVPKMDIWPEMDTVPELPALDVYQVRALRQMGLARRSGAAARKEVKPLVQRRRLERLERLEKRTDALRDIQSIHDLSFNADGGIEFLEVRER